MGRMKYSFLAVFLAGSICAIPLWAQSSDATEENAFFEQVDVNIINVEVFVTDRDGQRVSGLRADHFELFEDGEKVEISNFYAVARQDPATSETASLRGLTEPAVLEAPEDQRLHLVVYVDHFQMRPENLARVMESLEPFLEDRLRQGDRVMLVSHNNSLEVIQEFTRDRRQLLRSLERLGEIGTQRQILDVERRIAQRRIRQSVLQGQDLQTAQGFVRSYIQSVNQGLERSTSALEVTMRSLSGLPGRKAVLLLSDGMPMRPGEDLNQFLVDSFGNANLRAQQNDSISIDPSLDALREDQSQRFQKIIRRANAHQVTVYALDTRGTAGSSSLSASTPGVSAGAGGSTLADSLRTQGLQEPLIQMAVATGGDTALNTFNFAGALADLSRDFDSYYSLGYRSAHGGDGVYRKLEVRIKVPDLVIRHRRGFIDAPANERISDRTLASLMLDGGKNPLGVAVAFGEVEKESRERYVLPVIVQVPIGNIALLPRGETHQGRLRFFVAVRDDDGVTPPHEEVYPVEIPSADLEAASQQSLGYVVRLRVRPGTPTLAVGVWDEIAGTEAFVHQQTRVGNTSKRRR